MEADHLIAERPLRELPRRRNEAHRGERGQGLHPRIPHSRRRRHLSELPPANRGPLRAPRRHPHEFRDGAVHDLPLGPQPRPEESAPARESARAVVRLVPPRADRFPAVEAIRSPPGARWTRLHFLPRSPRSPGQGELEEDPGRRAAVPRLPRREARAVRVRAPSFRPGRGLHDMPPAARLDESEAAHPRKRFPAVPGVPLDPLGVDAGVAAAVLPQPHSGEVSQLHHVSRRNPRIEPLAGLLQVRER